MNSANRRSILLAYISMLVIAFAVLYLLEHTLLQLPLWLVVLSAGLSAIAVSAGTLLAIRSKPGNKR
jgi:hypothetical protein